MAASRWRTTPAVDPFVATDPLLQPDVMALMVQDAVLSRSPLPLAHAGRPPGPPARTGIIRDADPASRDLPASPLQTHGCRQEGSCLRPCPADQVQIPASNIAMACAISVTLKGVVTSTPGVSYLSITRLETGSEYLSKQSHSISNIGAGAEQPRQHRCHPAPLAPVVAISGLPASSYEVNLTSRHLALIACHQGLPVLRHEVETVCAVATPC